MSNVTRIEVMDGDYVVNVEFMRQKMQYVTESGETEYSRDIQGNLRFTTFAAVLIEDIRTGSSKDKVNSLFRELLENKDVYVGVATQHYKDKYNKRVGEKLALTRALKQSCDNMMKLNPSISLQDFKQQISPEVWSTLISTRWHNLKK